jgi:hypothetical protein
MDDVGLIQLLSIPVHHAIFQANVVARDSNDAFHDIGARLSRVRVEKNNDIAAFYVPVRLKRPKPVSIGREPNAVHENVVADKERVLHRA